MAVTINGSGTIGGLSAGGLPDGVVTQPDLASGVAGNGPAFFAYPVSALNFSNGATVKVNLNTKSFDTNNCFDSATNYRFTPNVAGYYFVTANMTLSGSGWSNGYTNAYIYKNGSAVLQANTQQPTNGNWAGASVSGLVYMNGSTDYIEMYVNHAGATTDPLACVAGPTWTYMTGFLARAA